MSRLKFLLVLAALFPLTPQVNAQTAVQFQSAFENAAGDPDDDQKVNAFLKMLPMLGRLYIVEGDIKMTRRQVINYLINKGTGEDTLTKGPELIVNLVKGKRDYWEAPEQRNLTYFVKEDTFADKAQYDGVVKEMREAADKWEAACPECGIKFSQLSSPEKAKFTVEGSDIVGRNGRRLLAIAFFPSADAPSRRLLVDRIGYFRYPDRVGVLTHEIGHILGYRHEHIRAIPVCAVEDSGWTKLTPYDPNSVMHYFCGKPMKPLVLTRVDIEGHKRLYGPRAAGQ